MTQKQEFLIKMILQHEGGYCNIDGDAGGMTYKGIARNCNPKWSGWKIVDKHLPLKYNQIIKDTELDNLVLNFYVDKFYVPCKLDEINSMLLSGHLICHAVNAGIRPAVKLLQKAINKVYQTSLSIDGQIGKKTLDYCNETNVSKLINQFIIERNEFYTNIVKTKPSQKKFLQGWLNRVKNTTKYCSR